MNDNVASINENPIALTCAFCLGSNTGRFQLLDNVVCHGVNQPCRAARCDDHFICDGSFTDKVDGDDVYGFIVLKRGLYTFDRMLQVDRSFFCANGQLPFKARVPIPRYAIG